MKRKGALPLEDFDDVEFNGIPAPPTGTRFISGHSSEVVVPYGDPAAWRMDIQGTGWCLHVPTGTAHYKEDLLAGIYES